MYSQIIWHIFATHNRSGDPHRALRYFNRACNAGSEDENLYILRCQCHMRLGNFALADGVCGIIHLYLFRHTELLHNCMHHFTKEPSSDSSTSLI